MPINAYTAQLGQEAREYYFKLVNELPDGDPIKTKLLEAKGHNDALDAFRHAYTSGAFVQMYSEWIGEKLGDFNEIYHSNNLSEHGMDLWNNEVGRRLGGEVSDNDELASQVFQKLINGTLIREPDDERVTQILPQDRGPDTQGVTGKEVENINTAIRNKLDSDLNLSDEESNKPQDQQEDNKTKEESSNTQDQQSEYGTAHAAEPALSASTDDPNNITSGADNQQLPSDDDVREASESFGDMESAMFQHAEADAASNSMFGGTNDEIEDWFDEAISTDSDFSLSNDEIEDWLDQAINTDSDFDFANDEIDEWLDDAISTDSDFDFANEEIDSWDASSLGGVANGALGLIQAFDDGDILDISDSAISIFNGFDGFLDANGMDGFISDGGSALTGGIASVINLVQSIDSLGDVLQGGDPLSMIQAGAGTISSAISVYNMAASAMDGLSAIPTSLPIPGLSSIPITSLINIGCSLAQGDVEGAIKSGVMAIAAMVPVYGWAAAAAFQAFSMITESLSGPDMPTFHGDVTFDIDADGNVSYNVEGDRAVQGAGHNFGNPLVQLISQLNEAGIQVDNNGIPRVHMALTAGESEIYTTIDYENTANTGKISNICDSKDVLRVYKEAVVARHNYQLIQDAIEEASGSADLSLFPTFDPNMPGLDLNKLDEILDELGFERNGSQFKTKDVVLNPEVWQTSGTGVFSGGGNVGGARGKVELKSSDVESLPMKPAPTPAMELKTITEATSLDRNYAAGSSGLMAVALGAGGLAAVSALENRVVYASQQPDTEAQGGFDAKGGLPSELQNTPFNGVEPEQLQFMLKDMDLPDWNDQQQVEQFWQDNWDELIKRQEQWHESQTLDTASLDNGGTPPPTVIPPSHQTNQEQPSDQEDAQDNSPVAPGDDTASTNMDGWVQQPDASNGSDNGGGTGGDTPGGGNETEPPPDDDVPSTPNRSYVNTPEVATEETEAPPPPPPLPEGVHFVMDEDTVHTVSLADFLSGDHAIPPKPTVPGPVIDPPPAPIVPQEVISVGAPSHGKAWIENGEVCFQPDADYFGEAHFNYIIKMSDGGVISRRAMFTVNNVNDAPETNDDAFTLEEDTPFELSRALANDVDVDGDQLNITNITGISNGALSQNADGKWVFTPTREFAGDVDFQYFASDGIAAPVAANIKLSYLPVNDAPDIGADTFTMLEDTTQLTSVNDLLANDIDIEGDNFSFLNWGMVSNGSLTESPTGEILFTPNQDFFGQAGFEYTVADEYGASSTGWVGIDVQNVNDVPVPKAGQPLSMDEDGTLSFSPDTISQFVTDVDNDTLSLDWINNVTNGSVQQQGNSWVFTPDQNYFGTASLEYQVNDGHGGIAVGQLDIDIAPVNDLPVVGSDAGQTLEEQEIVFKIQDLLLNDTDVEDGANLTFVGLNGALFGSAWLENDEVHFLPQEDFFGTTKIGYRVVDSEGGVSTGFINVDVDNVNDAPVALDDSNIIAWSNNAYENIYDSSVFLANDYDVDLHLDSISVVSVGSAEHGTVSLDNNGRVHYTPEVDWEGTDNFTYTISDTNGELSTATASFDVKLNTSPEALSEVISGKEDVIFNIPQETLLANESDIDNDNLFIQSVGNAQHGTVSILANGQVQFIPTHNFYGTASFDYQVSDGISDPVVVKAFVELDPVNDAPIVSGETINNVREDDSDVQINKSFLLSNDWDVEGDSLDIGNAWGASHGSVWKDGNGNVHYRPAANFNGTDSFSYSVVDGNGGVSNVNATVNVQAVNDNPVAQHDSAGGYAEIDNSYSISSLLSNDYDIDGDHLSISRINGVSGGNAWLSGGNLCFKAQNQGNYSIDYTVSDSHGGYANSRLNLSIGPRPNRAPEIDGINGLWGGADQSGGVGGVTVNAHDPDGDQLTYTLANFQYRNVFYYVYNDFDGQHTIPVNISMSCSINSSNGAVSWRTNEYFNDPNFVLPIEYTRPTSITVNVSDGKASAQAGYSLPIVLDMDGNGLDLIGIEGGAKFDWDDDGVAEATGWIKGNDAILVYDFDHDQKVTHSNEISFIDYAPDATTDMEGLRAFDSNADGMFSSADEKWIDFGIWQDKDSNGVTDEKEYKSLDEAGIVEIDLNTDQTNQMDENGNILQGTSQFKLADGTTGEVGDVAFTVVDYEISQTSYVINLDEIEGDNDCIVIDETNINNDTDNNVDQLDTNVDTVNNESETSLSSGAGDSADSIDSMSDNDGNSSGLLTDDEGASIDLPEETENGQGDDVGDIQPSSIDDMDNQIQDTATESIISDSGINDAEIARVAIQIQSDIAGYDEYSNEEVDIVSVIDDPVVAADQQDDQPDDTGDLMAA